MSKVLLLTISLVVVVITAIATYTLNSNSQKSVKKSELDVVVNQAKYLYRLEKEKGRDFSAGPCLSNALMPGWVLDVAHKPRVPSDDLPENQCSAFREGTAAHFVELDTDGNLIRAR